MTPLAIFVRTLFKTSAIFIGATFVILHPSLEWTSAPRAKPDRHGAAEPPRGSGRRTRRGAQGHRRRRPSSGGGGARRDRQCAGSARVDRGPQGQRRGCATARVVGARRDRRCASGQCDRWIAEGQLTGDSSQSGRRARRVERFLGGRTAHRRDSRCQCRRPSPRDFRAGRALDARALQALTAALKDEDVSVRRAAIQAIAEIGGDGGGHNVHVPHPHPHPHPNPHPIPTRTRIPIRASTPKLCPSGTPQANEPRRSTVVIRAAATSVFALLTLAGSVNEYPHGRRAEPNRSRADRGARGDGSGHPRARRLRHPRSRRHGGRCHPAAGGDAGRCGAGRSARVQPELVAR